MSFVKGLSGFIAGTGAGVIAVAAVSLYVPQFQGSDVPTEETVTKNAPEDVTEPPLEAIDQSDTKTTEIVKESEENTTTTDVLKEEITNVDDIPEVEDVTAEVAKIETPKSNDAEIDQSIPKEDNTKNDDLPNVDTPQDEIIQSESETVLDEPSPKESIVEESQPDTPKIVLNSELPKAEGKPKKFKLPTIEAEKPEEEVSDTQEIPKTENNITVGKKPSSNLPKITEDTPETEVAVDAGTENRALELNATKFEGNDKPLMGVILRDVGDKGLTVDQLKKLNTPITIAIVSDAPNASERALEYYAAGFEVIAMASDDRGNLLNTANNTQQIQDAMDVTFNNVPNAIGILDSSQAKIQKNGRTSKAIVENFVESGHGLITYAKGLNSVDREASAAGVRTGKVARKLDDNRENKALIGRYLDRVSLDAGRDGSVIVLGTTAKETVAALASWLVSSKGQSVTVAPASAVLLGK